MVRSAARAARAPRNDLSDSMIVDGATGIFADLCEPGTVNAAEEGIWPQALWDALEAAGLTLTWVPDTLGGAGAEVIDGFQVLRVAGRFAAPVPLAETLLAGWLLAQAKIAAPAGPMTIAPVYEDGHIELAGHTLTGPTRHIPFARNARHIRGAVAGGAAAAGAAAAGAAEALANQGLGSELVTAEIAVAKLRVGEAAGTGAAIAHQVHGAMGFTYEHSLHHATGRLWAWREEFGNETQWAIELGHIVAERGADALWPFITQGS